MTRRLDKPSKPQQPYIRSNSRQSRDTPSNPKLPIRSFKDFGSYNSQIQNSSGHSDLPSNTPSSGKRSSKITSLQQEFEDLKRKIREVENKNQKIIEKISSGKEMQKRRSEEVSQNQSGYENENEVVGKYMYNDINTFPDNKNKWPPVPHPHRRTPYFEAESEPKSLMEIRAKDTMMTKKGNDSVDLGYYRQNSREKNRMKVDMVALQDKYNKEQSKLDYVKNNFKNYSDCVKLIIQNQLGQFMDSLEKMMQVVEAKNNKNRERLNRLDGRLNVARGSKRRQSKLSSSFDLGSKRRDKSEVSMTETNKAKTKQFEALINKYEQLLRSKNDEIQKLSNQIKIKEREMLQISDKFDQMKEEKRKMGHEHDDLVARLQSKIQALMDKPPAAQTKKKQFINLALTKQRDRERDRSREKERQREKDELLSEKYLKQIKILESKLSFTQSRLQQKLKNIQTLQLQINNINFNKMNLINEYQQTLERTRQSHKTKYEELFSSIQTLKALIKSKEDFIVKQTVTQKQLEHKCIQLQIQLNTLNQKLLLKEDIEKMERSAVKRAYEIEENIPIENMSFTSENNYHTTGRLEKLEQEKRQLQYGYERLKGEFEIYKMYSKSNAGVEQILRQKESIIRDLRQRLQKSQNPLTNVQSPLFKRKETNLLLDSKLSDNREVQDMKQKIRIQDEDIFRLKNINEKLKEQNILVNSKAIGLGHDINLNEELHKQQQQKIKEMKLYIDQLEKTVSQLQKIINAKDKQLEKEKQSHQKQFTAIENELKVMEDEFAIINSELIKQTDKVNIKVLEVKKLQEENQDLKVQLYQNSEEKQRLQIQLEDIQQDTKKHGLIQSRVNEEYKDNVLRLKEQLQKLYNENTSLAEINKHQKVKIEELELEVFMDGHGQDDCMSEVSDIKTETLATKLRTLENINLENDISKANLERHLKNAEENNTKLMHEVHQLISELEKKKSQFSSTIISYDERIHQLEEMLTAAETVLKEKEKEEHQHHIPHHQSNLLTVSNDKVYKSDIKSQSSLMFSNTSQFYGDKEIDFKLSDDGGSEVGEINVEAIFNNINYPYENIKLRRKDQVEFIKNTALLINRLKSTINQKNRKIKGLEKKVMPERRSTDFGGKLTQSFKSEDFDDMDDFNQNYSVRFDDKKNDKNRKLKQLQNQTHLVMQENNLLLQQVTNLQDQLQKSQDQQNNLVRLKQILKEQVKKLQKALDQKEALHQEEINKTQRLIQENQSMHNNQTMRVILPKVFAIACNEDYMRRDEKRRQLEEYIKIVCTILKIEFVPMRYSGRR